MKDTLVIDIETQNFFSSPDRNDFENIKISVIGLYSYLRDQFLAFDETEIEKALEIFKESELIVGFAINRYDIPVLDYHFKKIAPNFYLWSFKRLDILDEIELALNRRVKLNSLALTNLQIGKNGSGEEAIELYKNKEIAKLKEYCLNDVLITRDIYNLGKKQNYILVPRRKNENPVKLLVNWQAKLF